MAATFSVVLLTSKRHLTTLTIGYCSGNLLIVTVFSHALLVYYLIGTAINRLLSIGRIAILTVLWYISWMLDRVAYCRLTCLNIVCQRLVERRCCLRYIGCNIAGCMMNILAYAVQTIWSLLHHHGGVCNVCLLYDTQLELFQLLGRAFILWFAVAIDNND